jgi:hypothetical protein
MHTVQELFELLLIAQQSNNANKPENRNLPTWFFSFSGHVNKLEIRYYQFGWTGKKSDHIDVCDFVNLDDDDSIQEAYYFVKNRLSKDKVANL